MFNYVKKIEVEDLFGYYDYSIDTTVNDFTNEQLIIIYGDNGSGKTTLLELLFYLTSTADNEGHKSKLARIRFKKVSVTLNNGMSVVAHREAQEDNIGTYHFTLINEKNEIIDTVHFTPLRQDSAIVLEEDAQETYNKILQYIRKIKLQIHYLSDKRNLLYGFSSKKLIKDSMANVRINYNHHRMKEAEEEDNLEESVKILESWIKKHILEASRAGDRNTNSIYIDLIKEMSIPLEIKITSIQIDDLIKQLVMIHEENVAYVINGFSSRIDIKEIEGVLRNLNTNLELIYHVLKPYINGLRARLDSLRETQNIINLFLITINEYFTNKTMKYNINNGFKIEHNHNCEEIKLNMLSSGEKQLLLLFCHVITSSDQASIFIIDEPEISLNIKWQRKLIDTLLAFTENKNVQFIFASHSFEILSEHKTSVYKLINTKE